MPQAPRGRSRSSAHRPESRLVTSVRCEARSPAQVARRFEALLAAGAELKPAGRARRNPRRLLRVPSAPRHEIRLFDATYFLSDQVFNEALGFFVGYVVLGTGDGRPARAIHPRIFYKDSSLVWRVASHYVHDHREFWIGKGDVAWIELGDGQALTTLEETTNLPYEVQSAFDAASRARPRRKDGDLLEQVLRQGPSGRIEPYADFVAPRRAAAARYQVNGGRPVARFTRKGDPSSLRFSKGFAPDFDGGVLEQDTLHSRFYGGALRKWRILSDNGLIQYVFLASPTHEWISPPQTLTTELSTYGVRVHDVLADEDLFIPGYEYHDEGEPEADAVPSQIPAGYVGAPHPDDPNRADAGAWNEALPIIQEFRAQVLRGRRTG